MLTHLFSEKIRETCFTLMKMCIVDQNIGFSYKIYTICTICYYILYVLDKNKAWEFSRVLLCLFQTRSVFVCCHSVSPLELVCLMFSSLVSWRKQHPMVSTCIYSRNAFCITWHRLHRMVHAWKDWAKSYNKLHQAGTDWFYHRND